jgi:hypothetical protein
MWMLLAFAKPASLAMERKWCWLASTTAIAKTVPACGVKATAIFL